MTIIEKAGERELESILALDGHVLHQDFLTNAIRGGHCWVAWSGAIIVGFIVLEQSFYEQGFIGLLVTRPEHRRRGVATALVRHIESICPTEKLFTSTNQSNTVAQKLFESLGFVRSGYIENLDEGDPEIVYFKRLSARR